jgi:hypothetical protein
VLLAFAKAVINGELIAAHQGVAPGPGAPVGVARAHNPGLVVFSENELPALFGWRVNGEAETDAEDYEMQVSTISLLWIMAPAQQEHLATRAPIVNGVVKALTAALKRGRHPSWVVAGDEDRRALHEGSFLHEWAGWFDLARKIPWKLQELVVSKLGDQASYPAVQIDLTVRERVFLGQSTNPNQARVGLHLPGEPPLVELELPSP